MLVTVKVWTSKIIYGTSNIFFKYLVPCNLIHLCHCLQLVINVLHFTGARCSSIVRAFTHGVMGRQIDPS